METTTLKTQLELSTMPIQKYEFTCGICFMVRPIMEHSTYHGGGSGSYDSCTNCEPRIIFRDR